MSTENEISKTIAFSDGSIVDIEAVKKVVYDYWKLNSNERNAFIRAVKKWPNGEENKPLNQTK